MEMLVAGARGINQGRRYALAAAFPSGWADFYFRWSAGVNDQAIGQVWSPGADPTPELKQKIQRDHLVYRIAKSLLKENTIQS
jgi:hypothetical protein